MANVIAVAECQPRLQQYFLLCVRAVNKDCCLTFLMILLFCYTQVQVQPIITVWLPFLLTASS